MTVDKALEHADKRLDSDCRTLAAEVRRLRAILEPTQDARELARELSACAGIEGEPGHEQVIIDDPESLSKIAARDVEIRRDAFEAGYAQGHNDTVEGCTRDMHDAANDYIAAIIGKEE